MITMVFLSWWEAMWPTVRSSATVRAGGGSAVVVPSEVDPGHGAELVVQGCVVVDETSEGLRGHLAVGLVGVARLELVAPVRLEAEKRENAVHLAVWVGEQGLALDDENLFRSEEVVEGLQLLGVVSAAEVGVVAPVVCRVSRVRDDPGLFTLESRRLEVQGSLEGLDLVPV